MNTNRFFVLASDIEGDQVRLSPEQSHQIQNVLRLRPGAEIIVLDETGIEYHVTLTAVEKRGVVGRVTAKQQARGEPLAQVTLYQSMLVREKFEWVLQKGTEIGVARFAPVRTERTIVRSKQIEETKLDRWRRILVEAAEQSHRGRIPKLDQIVMFGEALSELTEFDRCLIASPWHTQSGLREALDGLGGKAVSVALMVGPEGGFTDDEVDAACQNGAIPINLGPRILRTETCAVVASALVLHELGELQP